MDSDARGGDALELLSPSPRPGVESLKPLWLFSDDLVEIASLLARMGPLEIVAEEFRIDIAGFGEIHKCKQLLDELPVDWFSVSVPGEVNLMIFPTHVELCWSHDWQPEKFERDVVREVYRFLRSRCHILFFLGERGWQLLFAAFGIVVLLVATNLYLRGKSGDIFTVAGIFVAVSVLAWMIAGRFLPSRSHVTLYGITRKRFWRRIWRIVCYVVGSVALLTIGFVVGCLVCWSAG